MNHGRLAAVLATSATFLVASAGVAVATGTISFAGVPSANSRAGSPDNVVANGFALRRLINGNDTLENPKGIFARYGYLDDSALQTDGQPTKTEPDQNTYIVASNVGGPTAGYNYGRHFLIQGHEVFTPSGSNFNRAYFTRVNLDVRDPAHRVTLLNPLGANATDSGVRSIDGSSYYPFTGQMLYTAEAGNGGGVFGQVLKWSSTTPPAVVNFDGSMGKAGYEGIHSDKAGNLIIIEDVGGSNVTDGGSATLVKQPNSFVFRFKPKQSSDLTKGKLQVLQVSAGGAPITFHDAATAGASAARDDALGDPIKALHSGQTLTAKWVTIHDTDVDGATAFDANAAAKAGGVGANAKAANRGTPFKRPENAKYVPGTDFRSFVFTETGDTNKTAGDYAGAAARGAWGALLRVDISSVGADDASVHAVVVGDQAHAAFDNITFLDKNTALVGEDRGETLHQQANALDSLWAFDISQPLDQINGKAKRLVAQGRDPEATGDVGLREIPPVRTHNDGDNEVTGIHVSDGSVAKNEILGAEIPRRAGAKGSNWRIFVTGQHGANITYELVVAKNH